MAVDTPDTTALRSTFRLPPGPVMQRYFFGLWSVGVFAFLYIPIVLLVVFAFNDSRLNIRWVGFTTRWFGELMGNQVLINAFKNSLIVAVCTTILAVFLGTVGGWLLHRYRFPWQNGLNLLIFVPMVMPEVLMGISLLILFVNLHMPLGFVTLIIAHTTFCFPFVLVGVQARLQGIDPFLEEAAMDLGATPVQAFRKVIVPYLMPAVISGALMSFTLSFDEYIVTLFTTGAQSQTLPLKIYGMAKIGLNPQLNALSAIFVFVTIVLVICSEIIRRSK
jgi:spermidine/putrescine transport system permease protein